VHLHSGVSQTISKFISELNQTIKIVQNISDYAQLKALMNEHTAKITSLRSQFGDGTTGVSTSKSNNSWNERGFDFNKEGPKSTTDLEAGYKS